MQQFGRSLAAVALGVLIGIAVSRLTGPVAQAQATNTKQDELVGAIEKLLDDKLAKARKEMRDEISKDVKGQIDANNKQILATALTLQKTLRESLYEVALRAWSFERTLKTLLLQTPLFSEHVPVLGFKAEKLTDGDANELGIKPSDGFRITHVVAGSAAEKGGARIDDVIVASESSAWAGSQLPGERLKLSVRRGRKQLTVEFIVECKKCSDGCSFRLDEPPKLQTGSKSPPPDEK